MSLPLEGIKIIDFTQVQAGPACDQLLAWLGADVLKVERVDGGDITRHQLRDIPNVDALYFTQLNSNKRSLALNTKTPDGKAILEKLIRQADIFVENFGPGVMDRMGFSWERMQELNPRLISGTVKGFDDESPYSESQSLRKCCPVCRRCCFHDWLLGRASYGQWRGTWRQQQRNALGNWPAHCVDCP